MTDVQELGGHGVTAKVDGKTVAAGNARLMAKLGLTVPEITEPGTIVHVAMEGRYAGYLLIADVVKPHSAAAIRGLKQAGVRKTVMLTGDAEPVAKAVSAELGLDEYHAGLLPGDKVDQIETLLAAKQPKKTSLLWATASTMPRFCPVPMWASPWVLWAPMLPSRPLTLS